MKTRKCYPAAALAIGLFGICLSTYSSVAEAVKLNANGIHGSQSFIYVDDQGFNQLSSDRPVGLKEFLDTYRTSINVLELTPATETAETIKDAHSMQYVIASCLKGTDCKESVGATFQYQINQYKDTEKLTASISGPDPVSKDGLPRLPGKPLLVATNASSFSNSHFLEESSVIFRSETKQDQIAIRSLLERFPVEEIQTAIVTFDLEIKNTSLSCVSRTSAYCMIASNEESSVAHHLDEIRASGSRDVSDYLLFDYAIKTQNDSMALMLLKRGAQSIYFSSREKQLFAAAYYNLPLIADYLVNSDDMEIDKIVGTYLTPIEVAIQRNSLATLDILIDAGADNVGYLFGLHAVQVPLTRLDNHELFNRIAHRRPQPLKKSKLLSILLFRAVSAGQVDWLKQVKRDHPQLFESTLVDDVEYAKYSLMAGAILPRSETFDFLIESGLNPCLAFQDSSFTHFLKQDDARNSWIAKRYEDGISECSKRRDHT